MHETPVETESHLGLISVEVVGSDGRDGLHIVVVEEQDFPVELIGLSGVVKEIVDSGDANSQRGLVLVGF